MLVFLGVKMLLIVTPMLVGVTLYLGGLMSKEPVVLMSKSYGLIRQ